MNLTWTETCSAAGETYWASEVGKYRFVIEEDSFYNPRTPFIGSIELTSGHGYGDNCSATVEIGNYKTLSSAKAGLKGRAAKYGI